MLRKAIEGEPRLLIRHGRLLGKALREENLATEEVEAAVRAHGVARIEDVREAILETDASISVIPNEEAGTRRAGRDDLEKPSTS